MEIQLGQYMGHGADFHVDLCEFCGDIMITTSLTTRPQPAQPELPDRLLDISCVT